MKWFWKKRQPETVYVPPPVPSDDELIATAPHRLDGYTNIARGTVGYSIVRLAIEGRLKSREERGVLPDETVYIYEAVK